MRILVIEDDKEVSAFISKALKENGYAVDCAFDCMEGLYMATEEAYDVIILDRMLPKIEGLSLLKTLRDNENLVPVLMLSALGEVEHRIEGLRAGGDDYMTKPFSVSELIARIEVLLKRSGTQTQKKETVLQTGALHMDLLSRKVTRDGKEIDLKPREFRLLEYMMRNAGNVVTRTMLLEHVWDYNFDPQTNVIDVHISRLRNKIDKGFETNLLQTIRGAGYSIRETD
jgi:two-component system OmpR family response regulator